MPRFYDDFNEPRECLLRLAGATKAIRGWAHTQAFDGQNGLLCFSKTPDFEEYVYYPYHAILALQPRRDVIVSNAEEEPSDDDVQL